MRSISSADRRAAVVLIAVCGLPVAARAQTATSTAIDVQDYWPGGGPSNAIALRSSDVLSHRAIGFGLVANYASEPMRFTDRATGAHVDGVGGALTTDFIFTAGLFDRVQLEIAVPFVVEQHGLGASALGTNPTNLATTALRDIRFDVGVAILQRARRMHSQGFGLRIDVGAAIPTGDRDAFEGGNGATFVPTVIADARYAGVTVTANAGARVRNIAAVGSYAWGNQALLAAGVSYRPAFFDRLMVGVDYVGLAALSANESVTGANGNARTVATASPMELFAGAHFAVDRGRDLEVSLAAGAPLGTTATVPAWRVIAGLTYAPRGNDEDGDGVLDGDDRCMTVPEDRDGFEDADGCPDPDNDRDGILDAADRCPNEAEDVDNFEDADGCPDLDNDLDGVPDAEDVCATVAEGNNPDLDRPGCPRPDRDRDNVLDADDRCPDEVPGAHPDPARPGCPLIDRDHDGVADGADACPDDPAGDHPDAFRRGCPDPDRDHDGVPNETDRCPDVPETINGVTDEDGCADEGDTHTSLGRATLNFIPPIALRANARALAAAQLRVLHEGVQRLRGLGSGLAGVTVEVVAASASPGALAVATRLATLVGDALVADGLPRALVTANGIVPSAGVRAAPGEVHIRATRAVAPQ